MKINVEQHSIWYFFYKGLRFLLLVAVVDIGLGFVLNQLYFSQKSGKYHRISHALSETEAEVLLAGTSHSLRHLVSPVFADSLNQTVYNIGSKGQNLYYIAALVDAILDRYQPDKIVLTIDRDMFRNAETYDKLSDLKPYYWREKSVQRHLDKRGPLEKIKLLSKLYTYNSTLLHILKYQTSKQEDQDGYLPLYEVSKRQYSEADRNLDTPDFPTNEEHLVLLEELVQKAKTLGVGVYFVISPELNGEYIHNSAIEAIASRHKVPLWNYSLDERWILKNELFGDHTHLNHQGAVMLSSDLVHKIKSIDSKKLAHNVHE